MLPSVPLLIWCRSEGNAAVRVALLIWCRSEGNAAVRAALLIWCRSEGDDLSFLFMSSCGLWLTALCPE